MRAGALLRRDLSFSDKMSPDAAAMADLALLFFDRVIERAPYTFDAYRQLWTLKFYLGDWNEPYKIMNRMREKQRELAHKKGIDGLGLRFIPEAVATNIGVMTHIEMYLKAMLTGAAERVQLVMLLKDVRPANRCFLDCFGEYLRVVDSSVEAEKLGDIADCLTDDIHWFIPFDGRATPISWAAGEVRKRWHDQRHPPIMRLTDSHRAEGAEALCRLGMPAGAWSSDSMSGTAGFPGIYIATLISPATRRQSTQSLHAVVGSCASATKVCRLCLRKRGSLTTRIRRKSKTG